MNTEYISIISKNNNNYIYSFNKKQTLLVHPLIIFFLELSKKEINIADLIKNKVIIKGQSFTENEVLYYYNKYLFLKDNEFLLAKNIDNSYRYDGDSIKFHLANSSQISFEVTDSCNLKCKYCIYGEYYTNRTKPENINLCAETAKVLLNNLVELWNTSLNSSENKRISLGFYGGEPLLNMELIKEIVYYVNSLHTKHYTFSFDMTTNGVLLSKHIKFLADNNFNLIISLDGGTDENNSYRIYKNNKPAFKDIYNNIIEIKNKYPKYFKEHINFNSVLHNKNSFSELYGFFQTKFNKTPLISEIDEDSVNPSLKSEFMVMKESINNSLHKTNTELLEIEKEHYVGFIDSLTHFLFSYSGYVKSDYLDLIFNHSNKKKLPTGTCQPFSRKVFVTARGEILPCERIGHQFILGKAFKDRLELPFDKIAKIYNKYLDNIDSNQCSRCYLKSSCGICMFKENIESKKIICSGFTNKTQFETIFSNNISFVEENPVTYSNILNKINYV